MVKYLDVEIPTGFERLFRIVFESHLAMMDMDGSNGALRDPYSTGLIDQLRQTELSIPQRHNVTDPVFQRFLAEAREAAIGETQ